MTRLRGFALRIAPASVFIGVFFLVPVGVLFAYSFGSTTLASVEFGSSLSNYETAVGTQLYVDLLLRTLGIAAAAGAISVALAFPLAYTITVGSMRRHGELILFLVIVSLFSAFIVRVYAWRTLLGRTGVINRALEWLGLADRPVEFLLYSRFAVILTFVNVLLPLAVLPLYASLAGLDRQVVEASRSLGASPLQTLMRVTLPLSSRGVLAAFALCFIVAAGDYVVPQLVGNSSSQLLGNVIVQWFGIAFNWPLGAALAFLLVGATAGAVLVFVLLSRRAGLRDRPA